jgi:hypothetical protein
MRVGASQGVAGQADQTKDKIREVAVKAAKKLKRKPDKPCRIHLKVKPGL